jgi:tetratricopeptide (TPR) repeat protein
MNPEESWSELAREPSIDVKGLARIQERLPRLRVDVVLTDAHLDLTFGKGSLRIELDPASSSKPGQRGGAARILPPDAQAADAILAAIARAAEAEVPARPHEPGFRPAVAVTQHGVHVTSGKASLLWITFEIGQLEGSSLAHRWHLLLAPGKTRGYLHVELPRGAASRDRLLAAFAQAIRDGRGPRSTPLTDPRCASATPWLEATALALTEELAGEIDLASARWGGGALFAARRDGEATVVLRCEGPSGFVEIARVEAPEVALYPSPTGAHVIIEARLRGGAGREDHLHATREILDVATGQRAIVVEKHERFVFGDTGAGALWSADGARVALSGVASFAEEMRGAVLVYDVKLGALVDATPIEGTFFASHWDGPTLCLRGGPSNGLVAFRWEPGRSDPRADAVLGRVSPGGRFALIVEGERTRVVDRRVGAFTGALPTPGGRFGHGDVWVTDEDEPQVIDLATFRYRHLAAAGRVLRLSLAEAAPRAIFHDGAQWLWGSGSDVAEAAPLAVDHDHDHDHAHDHPAPTVARRALAERRARRIEEASLLASEDASGAARAAIAALEARLRAEAALEAGNARGERDVEGALTRFEAAVHDAPELYEALHHCEAALGQLGRKDEQREVAGYLCERFPLSSEAWLVRSIALLRASDPAGALAAIERAITLDADGADLEPRRAPTVDLWQQRAAVHLAAGRKDDALTDVRAILDAEPSAKARLAADPDLAALRRSPLLRA